MRIVADTNIFVISLTRYSPYHKIYKSLVSNKFELLVSNEIVLEYSETISAKYNKTTAALFSDLLFELPNVIVAEPFYNWNLITADEEDNKFVDCAIAGQADFIVSEDKHFNLLKKIPFPKVEVIGIDKFLILLSK